MKKTSLLMLSVLLVSVFGAAFVFAEGTSVNANGALTVSADSVSSETNVGAISEDDLATLDKQAVSEVSSDWKPYPTIGAIVGQGYAIGPNNMGYFAGIAGLRIKLGNAAHPDQVIIKNSARLRIGDKNFRLVKDETSGDVAIGDSLTFDAYQDKNKVGTFTLSVSQSLADMKIRTGTLVLTTGESYQLTLATKNRLTDTPRAKSSNDQTSENDNSRDSAVGSMPAQQVNTAEAKLKKVSPTSVKAANRAVLRQHWWQFWVPKQAPMPAQQVDGQVDATATAQ